MQFNLTYPKALEVSDFYKENLQSHHFVNSDSLLERVDELLSGGFTVSDTWLVQAAGLRFTKEELTQILEQHETQHI